MNVLLDVCDCCDALLNAAEKAACPRWGQDALCDECAAGYAAVNPGPDPIKVADLVEASREHMLAAHRVQAAKPGTAERDLAEQHLHGGAYFRLRAALAAFI